MMLITHPHLVFRLRMSRSCTSSPPRRSSWRVAETFIFIFPFEDWTHQKIYNFKRSSSTDRGQWWTLMTPVMSLRVQLMTFPDQ
jgi:hypothetical protein